MSYYDRQAGLDDASVVRSHTAIVHALRGGNHLTRSETSEALEAEGIIGTNQRFRQLLMRAELDGLICSGELRGKQHTYALLEERSPHAKALALDEALGELTRRYFTGHGPALVEDFAWWSGLTIKDARAGIEMAKPHLFQETIGEKTYWFGPAGAPAPMEDPTVHLLPNYDEYLIAYKERTPAMHPALPADSRLLYDVLSRHFVVVNGRVVGGWRNIEAGKEVIIETRLLVPLSEPENKALHVAAEDYSRFLGRPVSIRAS
jgi:hypothetical protein